MCSRRAWECSNNGGGMFSMSHHTTIVATIDKNNNKITNFHNILKMIDDCEVLVLELMFVHRRRFIFRGLRKTFKSHFKYNLDYKLARYENVHKLLEAMLQFVWIQKICESQVVMYCFQHLEKLNMT
jgi:hypothetical protein